MRYTELQCVRPSITFHLSSKKALHATENNFEVIVVDVSDHLIERLKKTTKNLS